MHKATTSFFFLNQEKNLFIKTSQFTVESLAEYSGLEH